MIPEILRSDNFDALPVRHGFFTRAWGNCGLASAYDPTEIAENRERVADHLKVRPAHLLTCYQIHSPDVATVTAPWKPEDRPRADALVTKEPGIALGILTADCAPVLLVDPEAGVIGAAHAGWRGALTGILTNTVVEMEKLGAAARSIHAAIGPCIWQNSYEVGPEFPAPFLAENPANERLFRPAFRSGHYMFDLPGYVTAKLLTLGLASVSPSPADTLPDEACFFSYRRACLTAEDRAGSLISAIVLA